MQNSVTQVEKDGVSNYTRRMCFDFIDSPTQSEKSENSSREGFRNRSRFTAAIVEIDQQFAAVQNKVREVVETEDHTADFVVSEKKIWTMFTMTTISYC